MTWQTCNLQRKFNERVKNLKLNKKYQITVTKWNKYVNDSFIRMKPVATTGSLNNHNFFFRLGADTAVTWPRSGLDVLMIDGLGRAVWSASSSPPSSSVLRGVAVLVIIVSSSPVMMMSVVLRDCVVRMYYFFDVRPRMTAAFVVTTLYKIIRVTII